MVSTIKGFLNPITNPQGPRNHNANFRIILPNAMAKLIAAGLLKSDGHGSYCITPLGRRKLKELTNEK